MTGDGEKYLIWSNEHRAWWGCARRGYVRRSAEAGHYTRKEAISISCDALPGRRSGGPFNEIPVRLSDIEEMLARFKAEYPGNDPEPRRN